MAPELSECRLSPSLRQEAIGLSAAKLQSGSDSLRSDLPLINKAQEIALLIKAGKEEQSYAKLKELLPRSFTAQCAAVAFDAAKQSNPFTHPEVYRSVAADNKLCDALVNGAVKSAGEGQWVAYPILTETLRGLMRDYRDGSKTGSTEQERALAKSAGERASSILYKIAKMVDFRKNSADAGREMSRAARVVKLFSDDGYQLARDAGNQGIISAVAANLNDAMLSKLQAAQSKPSSEVRTIVNNLAKAIRMLSEQVEITKNQSSVVISSFGAPDPSLAIASLGQSVNSPLLSKAAANDKTLQATVQGFPSFLTQEKSPSVLLASKLKNETAGVLE